MMSDNPDRIKFDIACALTLVSRENEIPDIFPKRRELSTKLGQILERSVDLSTLNETSVRIRPDASQDDDYALRMGKDKLKLKPGGLIILGGSGVTIQLHDPEIKRQYALKAPRVSVLGYLADDFVDLDIENFEKRIGSEIGAFENERKIFRRLSHQNIAQHFFGSEKTVENDMLPGLSPKYPFSISEWINGAQPLHKYLRTYLNREADAGKELTLERVLALIEQSFAALAHIQERNTQHWDIKCDNLLVSEDHIAKLIDFGNAKKLDLLKDTDIVATTTKGKYPPVKQFVKEDTGQSESRRFRIRLPSLSWNHQAIDLWMLAQEWNRCLGVSDRFLVEEEDPNGVTQLTPSEREKLRRLLIRDDGSRHLDQWDCLRLILERVLFPFDPKYVDRVTRDSAFDGTALYYGGQSAIVGAASVLEELARITAPLGDAGSSPELLLSLDDIVRLPSTGNSVFTRRIEAVAETTLVAPTKGHNQLGQVKRVFPGASHLRYEHLLGTVTTAAQFVRALYLNEMNAFWRVSASEIDIDAVLLAALLHDVGHLAFGHFVEEMSDLFEGIKHTDYTVAFLNSCLQRLGSTPSEAASSHLFSIDRTEVDNLLDALRSTWVRPGQRDTKAELDKRVSILIESVLRVLCAAPPTDEKPLYLSRSGTRQALDAILRSIVDGPLDADKLDYLRRDSLHAGVFFANGIDLERFFESLRVCIETTEVEATLTPAIGVSEKGIAPVESIVTARYHLFGVIYWHRTTRCITAVLQRVLSEVRLALTDDEWNNFLTGFLKEFRVRDDAQALQWLEARADATPKIKSRVVGREDGTTTVRSLIGSLNRSNGTNFKMAFELSFEGEIEYNNRRNKLGREYLHQSLCNRVYPKSGKNKPSNVRKDISEFRRELEERFEEKIRELTGKKMYKLDTILLDVPEPGKDQISDLRVATRSKRNKTTHAFLAKLALVFPEAAQISPRPEFAPIKKISPIAGSLDHALDRWARKVRIFMTDVDLANLEKFDFAPGDIALLWEQVLYDRFGIVEDQYHMAK